MGAGKGRVEAEVGMLCHEEREEQETFRQMLSIRGTVFVYRDTEFRLLVKTQFLPPL